jgi:hemerythrin
MFAMRSLKWSTSHAVFVTEIDDDHREIFALVSELEVALEAQSPAAQIQSICQRLAIRIEDHFAHEERLMRAARYGSFQWHKQKHNVARKRAAEFAAQIANGEPGAGMKLVEYLTAWLEEHTRLADAMLGAFLRNYERALCKITFRAGTKPMDACSWVDSNGERFDPAATNSGI